MRIRGEGLCMNCDMLKLTVWLESGVDVDREPMKSVYHFRPRKLVDLS